MQHQKVYGTDNKPMPVLSIDFGPKLNGTAAFYAGIYGLEGTPPVPTNWSGNDGSALALSHIYGRVPSVKRALIPTPNHGVGVYPDTDFCSPHSFKVGDIKVYKQHTADGVSLEPGSAYLFKPADCCLGVMYIHDGAHRGKIVAAHVSRDNLLPHRTHGAFTNIAHAMLERLLSGLQGNFPLRRVRAFVGWGIKPEHFLHQANHPQYGARNKELVNRVIEQFDRECIVGNPDHGALDLRRIFALQCRHLRIPSNNVQTDVSLGCGLDTYTNQALFSHRRGDRLRNVVIVARRKHT